MLGTLFPSSFAPFTYGRISREIDRLFEATGAPEPGLGPSSVTRAWPGVNLWRDAESIVAEAEVPGFTIEDIEVLAIEDGLTIRGRRSSAPPQNAAALRVERQIGRFERSIRLPVAIEADEVQATLVDGVLRVTMPVARAARPRRVPVNAAPPGAGAAPLPHASGE